MITDVSTLRPYRCTIMLSRPGQHTRWQEAQLRFQLDSGTSEQSSLEGELNLDCFVAFQAPRKDEN